MSIKAIQTRYAGCYFRSRLEARWAVFFDRANIRWQYEPEGFELGYRMTRWPEPRCGCEYVCECTFPYLPDFWLPDLKLWVEVKGSLTDDELERLLDIAGALSGPHGGCGTGYDLLVLGPLPHPHQLRVPVRLHLHKGDLHALRWPLDGGCHGVELARDIGGDLHQIVGEVGVETGITVEQVRRVVLDGARAVGLMPTWFRPAIDAARSARFEHGQSGAA